ncbi:hypothetical protein B566_EDAN006118 [Ephemera danica]|nr:hypothetical protein B566_EDAN006118 [Ephemera danica]
MQLCRIVKAFAFFKVFIVCITLKMSENGDQEKDTKPDVAGDTLLNIKVLGHDSSVIQFKIKKKTNFAKLMKIYCQRMSDSPESIGMDEGDTLEVVTIQEGGSRLLEQRVTVISNQW